MISARINLVYGTVNDNDEPEEWTVEATVTEVRDPLGTGDSPNELEVTDIIATSAAGTIYESDMDQYHHDRIIADMCAYFRANVAQGTGRLQ